MKAETDNSRRHSSEPDGSQGLDLRTPTADDAVNGVMPTRVVRVRSVGDVVEVVRSAVAHHDPLVVRGGGTLLSIGNAPRALGSIIAMDDMAGLLSYSPEDMVVTIEAGMTLAAINRELSGAMQRVAIEAPDPHLATIGGLAAANFNTGIAYGAGYPRDQILGMTVVDGNCRILRAGGRVVKNVAGYDMPRLFTGSFGTLAVITDITLRTQPCPEACEDIFIGFRETASLEAARQRILRARLPLRRFDIGGGHDGATVRWRIRVEAEGSMKQVGHVRAAVTALSGEEGRTIDAARESQDQADTANFIARFALSPSAAIQETSMLLTTARTIVETPRAVLECGGSLVRLYATCQSGSEFARLVTACRERCAAGVDALLFERLPADQRNGVDVWCGPIRGLALMQRLKEKFDPSRVLAPGRFVGGI